MTETSYALEWARYRRANWAAGLWLILGFPSIVAAAMLLKLAIGEAAIVCFVVLVVAWALAWAVLCVRVTRFHCPRCKALYFSHSQLHFGAGSKCGNCGLPLYANE